MRDLSRRRFLGLTAGAGGALLLASAGCAGSGEASAAPDDLSEGRDRRLRIDNWADYIDPDADGTVARFQAATDIAVTYDEEYADNLTALADGGVIHQLQEGQGSPYDVIVPTYWVVKRLVARGLLEPIPLERIPNHVNVDPLFLEVPWDRGARWHMPWQAGLTGIAWDPAATGGKAVTSVAQLVNDPALKGRVGMVTEMREVVGLLLLARGHDPARVTADQARAALDDLQAIVSKGQVKYFTGSEFGELLPNKTFAACLAWSGDAVQIQATRPDLRFAIPDEGGIRWFDSMIIPKGADNVRAAADWMNFVYDPANAARITAAVQYVSPVLGVRDALTGAGGESAALAGNPILFPDGETRRRLFFWSGLDEATEDELQQRFDDITGPLVYQS
jgi:spermidine/putrescine transport system substrate-binding protein